MTALEFFPPELAPPTYEQMAEALVEWGRWHVLTELRHPTEFALWGLANRLVAVRTACPTTRVDAILGEER